MGFSFTSNGSFNKTETRLQQMAKNDISTLLSKYGQVGVNLLRDATPVESGASAAMWSFKVKRESNGWKLSWHNQNRTSTGVPVVILLQYGHGTGTGGYVSGRDFINPVIRPLFDVLVSDIRKEVTRK